MKKIIIGALIALTTTTSLFAESAVEEIKKEFITKSLLKNFEELPSDNFIRGAKINALNNACQDINEKMVGYNSNITFTNERGVSRSFDSKTFCISFNKYFQEKADEYRSGNNQKFIEKLIVFNIRGGSGFDKLSPETMQYMKTEEEKKKVIGYHYYTIFKENGDTPFISTICIMQSLVEDMNSKFRKAKDLGVYSSVYQQYIFNVATENFKAADSIVEKNVNSEYVDNYFLEIFARYMYVKKSQQ